jgi:hypothetical protein
MLVTNFVFVCLFQYRCGSKALARGRILRNSALSNRQWFFFACIVRAASQLFTHSVRIPMKSRAPELSREREKDGELANAV